MQNFKIENPTVLHFGRNVVRDLGKTVEKYGRKVLLIYGGGSIKKNGIYDEVMGQLKQINAEVIEYAGIKPNPIVEDVNAAAEKGKQFQPDVILAVGGGSVIDSAKVLSLAIPCEHSAWRIMINMAKPTTAIPLITVLTLAATGTEMNPFAVLQNVQTHKKIGYGNPLIYPRHSFLDPAFTFSVSRDYTAYGIVDLIAHALENYFGEGDASLSDRFVYSIIREAMEYGPALLDDLQNYDLRAKIMYAATCALNGLTVFGRVSGDWGVHDIGHVLSLMYDAPHGATLSVAYPAWLKLMKGRIPDRITQLGKAVFNASNSEETISSIEGFFKSIECPVRMNEIGINEDKKPEILDMMIKNKVNGVHYKLSKEDIGRVVELMY
ncbi:MAG: iron-containing alcohol dehydrogenase [Bacteroidetes bacterium]|nr:iron-containing alcohol dehydrogenase [Bacteroidota bacterium]MBL7105608.1 iron-containing alcohol dehydrogenase [Bacteroidales bacterium]